MDLFESATISESFEPVFTGQQISNEDIRKVLETASLAPSPYNSQPWEFIIIQHHIREISSVVSEAIDDSHTCLSRDRITDYILKQNNLLVYLEDTTRQDPGENAYKLGLISMGTALSNLILAASVMGIGIQPITFSPGKDPLQLREYLKIPPKFRIHSLFAMGYLKDKNSSSRKEKPTPVKVHVDRYGTIRQTGELKPVLTPWDGFSLIKRRKSYRKNYQKRQVTKECENDLIKAARDSFFFNTRRNWELIFIKDKSLIDTLADLISDVAYKIHMDEGYFKKMRAWMRFTREEKTKTADGVLIVMWSNLLGYILKGATYCLEKFAVFKPFRALFVKRHSKEFFGDLVRGAPLIIVITYNKKELDSSGLSYELNTISIGVGIQNMLLAATAREMGAQFLSILVDTPDGRQRMKELLYLPDDVEIVDLMRVGYIDEGAPDPMLSVDNTLRRPVEKIAHVEFYQEFFGVLG